MSEAALYVVTSDEARNGKTLVARLLTEYLILAHKNPVLFDAGWPAQGLKDRWPERTFPVDFQKVQGQMALFDRVLSMPVKTGVVDLSWRDLPAFMALAEDIRFKEEASSRGYRLVLFYVIGAMQQSRLAGERIAATKLFREVHYFRPAMIKRTGMEIVSQPEIIVPQLTAGMMTRIERPTFSIGDFLRGRKQGLNYLEEKELNGFLDTVMGAIDAIVSRHP
jgi:hypothetical protein